MLCCNLTKEDNATHQINHKYLTPKVLVFRTDQIKKETPAHNTKMIAVQILAELRNAQSSDHTNHSVRNIIVFLSNVCLAKVVIGTS